MAGEHPGNVEALGKPPGWSHRKKMRDYIRSVAQFDRDLHKEVARQNAANKIKPESMVQQIIHDPLPIIETKPMNTNKTGLASLSAAIAELKAAQQQALSAGETLHKGISEAKEAANEYVKLARQVEQETAEAMAALGQISNGGPE